MKAIILLLISATCFGQSEKAIGFKISYDSTIEIVPGTINKKAATVKKIVIKPYAEITTQDSLGVSNTHRADCLYCVTNVPNNTYYKGPYIDSVLYKKHPVIFIPDDKTLPKIKFVKN